MMRRQNKVQISNSLQRGKKLGHFNVRSVFLWVLFIFGGCIAFSTHLIHRYLSNDLLLEENKSNTQDPIIGEKVVLKKSLLRDVLSPDHYYFYADDLNLSWEGDLPKNIIAEARQTIGSVHIVVSHCDKSLDWIEKSFLKDLDTKISGVTVITKCDNEVTGLSENLNYETVKLPNVGRCDHSYAYWITRYSLQLASEDTIVLFMKDSFYQTKKWRKMSNIVGIAARNGFACTNAERFGRKDFTTSIFHDTNLLSEFHIESHTREGKKRDYVPPNEKEKSEFAAVGFKNLGQYANFVGIDLQKPFVPVCYGGVFATTLDQIRQIPTSAWSAIEKSLSRRDNLEEGHYMERLWAPILTKPLHADTVSKIRNQMHGAQCNMKGAFAGWFRNHCGILTYIT